MPKKRGGWQVDWVYVSKDTVKKWALALVVGAVAVVIGVQLLVGREETGPERAKREIAAADELIGRCRQRPEASHLKEELDAAVRKLSVARTAFDEGRISEAISSAVDAQSIARQMLSGLTNLRGDANIIDVGGKVEVQRANRNTWEPAKIGSKLFEGDFVKTGPTGAAEVMAADGTLYRIRDDSLFEVHRTSMVAGGLPGQETKRSEVKLVVGVIDTNTGETSRSIVKTDAVTTDIASKSSVGIDVDTSKTTGVSTFKGSAVLSTESGQKITVGERERVVAAPRGGGITVAVKLPDAPLLKGPDDNDVFDLRKAESISLRWSGIREAGRYRLQIARSRLFIPDSVIVDLNDRVKTESIVGVTEEGSYFWRVAAHGKGNLVSEWSPVRRFKVVSGNLAAQRDTTPPDITLERSKVISNYVLVSGKTEPGATVTVNGEAADVDASGGFKKMIFVDKDGYNTIVVRATDGAGNESLRRETVLIQN